MKHFIALLLLLLSTISYADDLSKIAGKYNYEQYRVTLGSGNVLSMKDIGAKSITIEFNKDATIFMEMNMLDGKTINTTALIKKIEINGNEGYLIEKWPDMNYTVRNDFSFNGENLEYQIKFENKDDPMRYGTVERAVLRKIKAF